MQYNSDQLFQMARTEAFEKTNYPRAISLTKQALVKSPDYGDIRIFLGRLYTWTDKPDSARTEFSRVIRVSPDNKDLYLAYGSLEYWESRPDTALILSNKGLSINPRSEDLLLLKARLIRDLKQLKKASATLNQLSLINPKQNSFMRQRSEKTFG